VRRGRDDKFASVHQCRSWGKVGMFGLFSCNLLGVLGWLHVQVKCVTSHVVVGKWEVGNLRVFAVVSL